MDIILSRLSIDFIIGNIANDNINILATLTILVIMVKVGKTVKYDDYGRVTCSTEIAELLDLEKGADYVEWFVENGDVILRKVTKEYAGGFDFEAEDIRQRLVAYEAKYGSEPIDDGLDFETAEARAREQYQRDMAARKALKNSKKG